MIPTHGTPPGARRWTRRPGVYAILVGADGRLLLTEQETEAGPELQLPGGGIDPGESPLPALARELREETGHTGRILRHLGSYRRFVWMPDYAMHAEKICHVFLGRAGPRVGAPSEPGHRAVWRAAVASVDDLASPGDAAILARWVGQDGRSRGRGEGWGRPGRATLPERRDVCATDERSPPTPSAGVDR